MPDPDSRVTLSANCNPNLKWDDVPKGVRSFAVICCDPDVPGQPDDVNREGRTISEDVSRTDFYHWALIDIPDSVTEIASASHSSKVTPKGKSAADAPAGMRHGINDYTSWFAGDTDMGGQYFGYDGPCPPWNDSIVHNYHFTVYALDIGVLPVDGAFTGQQALDAMQTHIIDQASMIGTYALNPAVQ